MKVMESYEITQAVDEATHRIETPTRITGHNRVLGPYEAALFAARTTYHLASLPLKTGTVAGASEEILRGMASTADTTAVNLRKMIYALRLPGDDTLDFFNDLDCEASYYALILAKEAGVIPVHG